MDEHRDEDYDTDTDTDTAITDNACAKYRSMARTRRELLYYNAFLIPAARL